MDEQLHVQCDIEGCGSVMASWRTVTGQKLCQLHHDDYLRFCDNEGIDPGESVGLWKEQEGEQEQVERPESPEPDVTFADFEAFVRQRAHTTGQSEALVIKQAIVGANSLFPASDRWARLEAHGASLPVWLRYSEAVKVVKILRGAKGPEARVLMQEIRDRFGIQ